MNYIPITASLEQSPQGRKNAFAWHSTDSLDKTQIWSIFNNAHSDYE